MKNPLSIPLITVMFFIFCYFTANAQKEINLSSELSVAFATDRQADSPSKDGFLLTENSYTKFSFSNSISSIKTIDVNTPEGIFTQLIIPGYSKSYNIGEPALPVLNKLIEIPQEASVTVNIISYDEEIIVLSDYGIYAQIIPCQPSVSKSADPSEIEFIMNKASYQKDEFTEGPVANVEILGSMRGVKLGRLTIAPFWYNPVQNTIKVLNNIVAEISFHNANISKTNSLKEKYYSPHFESTFKTIINYQSFPNKDVISKYPIKYVIVSDPAFQTALQPFIEWKTKKGFYVEVGYTDVIGSTKPEIKAYLQNLYDSGTPADPAPTYVLLVGDVAQIPAYSGAETCDNHVSDLYYCEYDGGGDYFPEVYYGRFSAENVTELQPQIDKTLEYEQYLMPDPSFLNEVVMIAGVDATYAPTYGNGQINYGTDNYFNAAHGLTSYTYLYPASDAPGAAAEIIQHVSDGVGYANYTAHCSEDGWSDPSFSISDISGLTNANEYSLMVANCCRSNKFEVNDCFGEEILQAANKGALGHIGGSNYSYWDEDYYWGVGYGTISNPPPAYGATTIGAYDGVFHDHGEAESDWFVTSAQMMYSGNLAVTEGGTALVEYYWEIYHLMGDPSLMVYFSVPPALTATYTNPVPVGTNSLTVTTEPGAYVAISLNNVLLDAKVADGSGIANLSFTAFAIPDIADVVATRQNREPYIGTLDIITSSAIDAQLSGIIYPENSYTCYNADIYPTVVIKNIGNDNLTSLTVSYQIDGGGTTSQNWTGNLTNFETDTVIFSQIALTEGNHTFTAFTSLPNDTIDEFTSNDTCNKNFTVIELISNFSADYPTTFCNPPANVQFTNLSTSASSYLWDFGDGETSTETEPIHAYTADGSYDVTLIAYGGSCANDTLINIVVIDLTDAPVTTSAERCDIGSVTLTASGNGILTWYDDSIGGNIVNTGTTFITPSLSQTTNYYVEDSVLSPAQYVGKFDNSGGGAYFNSDPSHYLVFDCYSEVELVSVKVYASGTANRTIELRDNLGSVLQSQTINIPAGESRIYLNFNIPVDNDLQLAGPPFPDLYRNNNGISYPYTLSGLINIKYSSATSNPTGYYYYFYDWKVKEPDCYSARTIVTATINDLPTLSFSGLNSDYCIDATSVTLTGSPAGGTFTGTGITGNDFDPAIAGAGGPYDITYTYTDINSCTNADIQQVTVNNLPVADAGIDTSITFGTSATLDGTASGGSGGPYSYSWSPADSLIDALIEDPTTIDIQTSTIFTLTVTDDVTGCQNTAQVTVTVTGVPLSVNVIATPDIICNGNSSQLNVLPTGGSGTYTYAWTSNPPGYTDTTVAPVVSPLTTTIYTVTVDDGSDTESNSITVTVNDLPTVDLGGVNDTLLTTLPYILDAGAGFINYEWSTTETSQQITVNTSGWYSVTVTDTNGCSAMDSIYIDELVNMGDIAEKNPQITIYPNPSPGNFVLEFIVSEHQNIKLQIFNTIGQLVYYKNIMPSIGKYHQHINLNNCAKGIYNLQLISDTYIINKRIAVE